jgi:hypothetical protein
MGEFFGGYGQRQSGGDIGEEEIDSFIVQSKYKCPIHLRIILIR